MKLISFSLWGTAPKYCLGAVKNASLARSLFPDWICRFYCDAAVPMDCLAELKRADNVQVIQSDAVGNWFNATTRFLPMSEEGVEAMISRDADSRLSLRERSAVDAWLSSGRAAHIMRDHPHHGSFPIMGGMFGIRGNVVDDVASLIGQMEGSPGYNFDQDFLTKFIWPLIKGDCLVHDEFFEKHPFPTKRRGLEFVGQVFDEHDQPATAHAELLSKVLAMQALGSFGRLAPPGWA